MNESLSTKIRNLTRVGHNKGSEPWVSAEIHIPYESVQVMDGRLFGLPLEEWAFFVVIPFAGIASYEAVGALLDRRRH